MYRLQLGSRRGLRIDGGIRFLVLPASERQRASSSTLDDDHDKEGWQKWSERIGERGTHSQHPPSPIFRYLLKTPKRDFSHFRDQRNEDSIDETIGRGGYCISYFCVNFNEHQDRFVHIGSDLWFLAFLFLSLFPLPDRPTLPLPAYVPSYI